MVSRRRHRTESSEAAVDEQSLPPEPGSAAALAKAARPRLELAALLLERPLGCLAALENSGLPLSAELAAAQQRAIQDLWAATLATMELLQAYRRVAGQLAGAVATEKPRAVANAPVVSKARTGRADVLALLPTLTRRQAEVLEWLLRGLPNRDIAEKLGVSDTTVKAHVGEILRKLHVYNRTRLIAMLTRNDLPARGGGRR